MNERTSHVNNIDIQSLSFASVLEIGDSHNIFTFTKALAVQRQTQLFYGTEGDFSLFPIYRQQIPRPIVDEAVTMQRFNENEHICVKNLNIIGASTSAVIQIGSTKHIVCEARIKHIRQLSDPDE